MQVSGGNRNPNAEKHIKMGTPNPDYFCIIIMQYET